MFSKPENKKFEKVFDSVATRYDRISNYYAVSRRIDFFKKWAKGKCLEVGAGSGEMSKALLDKHEVVATDISGEMIKLVKKKLGIKAYISDAEKLPFKNNSFDTIIAAEMIYYLDRPQRFFQEARRILQPKGRLLISSASKVAELYDKFRAFLRKLGFTGMYFDDQNRQFMSSKQIKNLLRQEGFQIKQMERTIILPFKFFDTVNRFLEKTPIKCLSSFIYVYAEK